MVVNFILWILRRWRRISPTRRVGVVCAVVGLFLLVWLYGPIARQRLTYDISSGYPALKQKLHLAQNVVSDRPTSTEFGLVIPKLSINVPVVADVESDVPHIYFQKLRSGVAHYKGTAKPDELGNTVIYGHSSIIPGIERTPYDTIFVLIDKLAPGDPITLYWHNQRYLYQVQKVQIKSDQALEILDQAVTTPTLTLLTCWPPGTDLKRLIVTAERQNN